MNEEGRPPRAPRHRNYYQPGKRTTSGGRLRLAG